jgi:hypothetical protein
MLSVLNAYWVKVLQIKCLCVEDVCLLHVIHRDHVNFLLSYD